ncbi:hypothetical protein Q9Q94_09140 [Uliginosibacterium sp. 31-16]|nr:hypothetical protein [Uliginosibacterium sp. 31-16]MDP5239694.1 hypothetical protein [Uliginosibacterium sp. 31-16]
MSKAQKSNKEAKKAPSMSLKEKREAKHAKKHARDVPSLLPPTAAHH